MQVLLVGTDDRAVGGRPEIKVDDGAHLGGEVGVDRLLPVGAAMRLDGGRFEDALNAPGADREHSAAGRQNLGQ